MSDIESEKNETAPAEAERELTAEDYNRIAEDAARVAGEILGFFPEVESPRVEWRVEDDSTIWIDIEGDSSGRLIGRRGQTIEAFQHVLSKIVSHTLRRKITIHVDSEGYKRRQRDKLVALAVQTADYVAATSEARALEPMTPAERRIVHMTLRSREDVITASEGREPSRFVVIWPRGEE